MDATKLSNGDLHAIKTLDIRDKTGRVGTVKLEATAKTGDDQWSDLANQFKQQALGITMLLPKGEYLQDPTQDPTMAIIYYSDNGTPALLMHDANGITWTNRHECKHGLYRPTESVNRGHDPIIEIIKADQEALVY